MKRHVTRACSAVLLTGGMLAPAAAPAAPPAKSARKPAPKKTAAVPAKGAAVSERTDPAAVWPVSLARLAGRYVFVQVATPGGLWETVRTPEAATVRQVSLNEIPAALRERLQKAEVVISDLKLPSSVEASMRTSPSKRGSLRFYSETAMGKLSYKGLPGIGGQDQDPGEFSGQVMFRLDHQSHSNPSPTGVLFVRQREEATWGVAIIDYGDLNATTIPEPEAPEPPNGAAKKGEPAEKHDHEGIPVMANARILRTGGEIFSYFEWTEPTAEGERVIRGCVRLVRLPDGADRLPQPMRPMPQPVRPMPRT